MSKKVIKPIVRYGHQHYVFESIDQAAGAIKFFGKLRPVEFVRDHDGDDYHYKPAEAGGSSRRIELETSYEFRETPKRLQLPAPKRGTVACAVCVSVSVKPGSACASCGTVAALL